MTPKTYEYVRSVNGLLIPDDADLKGIADGIDDYITLIPELAESLINTLFANKIPIFQEKLEILIYLLRKVNARRLVAGAEAMIKASEQREYEQCRKQIAPYITELYSLSIDMQMAQTRGAQEAAEEQSDPERYVDIVNNLSAAEQMIASGNVKKARDMLADMADIQNEQITAELLKSLALGAYKNAAELTIALKEQYIKKLERPDASAENRKQIILAVDDRPEILTAISQVLRNRYKVIGAPRGKAALKILESEQPSLFILDIEMPEMDGFQLAKELRRMERYKVTPIIFLTGNAGREYVVKAIEAGGNDFIVKPVNNNTLMAKISKFLP